MVAQCYRKTVISDILHILNLYAPTLLTYSKLSRYTVAHSLINQHLEMKLYFKKLNKGLYNMFKK